MLQDPNFYPMIIVAALAFAAIGVIAVASLRGWREWLALKHAELQAHNPPSADHGSPSAVSRIEVADLKERVKKLEAIAAGIDM